MPVAVATQGRHSGTHCSVNRFGIEVVESIVYKGWEPGAEYTKQLVLKNINVKTQKIKYRVPNTKFFTTLYPQAITLSAGTSYSLPVTFKPLEKNLYEDVIAFETGSGQFRVPIRAVLPKHSLACPKELNLDMCAVQDQVQATFELSNASELATTFQWETMEPFVVEPPEGLLMPRAALKVTVTFKPKAALSYHNLALCKYGDPAQLEHSTALRLSGIGKYPHLLVQTKTAAATTDRTSSGGENAVLDFGTIPVETTSTQYMSLRNLSPVSAPFTVTLPSRPGQVDTVFTCNQVSGQVPPEGACSIPLTFSPNTVGESSIDYVNVEAIGGISKTVVKLTGVCSGPSLSFSCKLVNFGRLDSSQEAGRETVTIATAKKSFAIINNADIPTAYQFVIDSRHSAFKFEQEEGVLEPGQKRDVIVHFVPTHSINYYRRVTCLIHNHEPLMIDLIGTCHSEQVKPAVLKPKHLDHYRVHVARGFSQFPPDQLNAMLKDSKLELDAEGCLLMPQAESMEHYVEPIRPLDPVLEYFDDGHHSDVAHSPPHVTLDVGQVDFGHCINPRLIEPVTVNLTNHTKGKVSIAWVTTEGATFSIQPATCDIPPLKTHSFQVTFKPNVPNQFFRAELECYAYYKSMRDYRLVEDETFCPPWCLTLGTLGHTFQPGRETFLPRYVISSQKMVFPASNLGQSVHKTLLLTNTGTTPIHFDFKPDPSGVYTVKPGKGLLKTGRHQVFVVRSKPSQVKLWRHQVDLRLNDAEKYLQHLLFLGSAEKPQVALENQGVVYFKPTCLGTCSTQLYPIKNLSRVPLCYQWKISQQDSQFLQVQPQTGVIMPNETQMQEWSFVPQSEGKLVMKPFALVYSQADDSDNVKKAKFVLRVVGKGLLGEIKAQQATVDFGDIVIGTSATREIAIYNDNDCDLQFHLHLDQLIDGPYPEEATAADPIVLDMEELEGVVAARSRHLVSATMRPARRAAYTIRANCQILRPDADQPDHRQGETRLLCQVRGVGVYPVLAVTDARCYGSTDGISKARLWNLFSIDGLNNCLDADPSAEELTYYRVTRHSTRKRPPLHTRAIIDFNFSAAPLGSEPAKVQLLIENTGTVPTDWAFLFPTDLQLELEYWAETGEFDADELHEMRVVDNKLFDVEPRLGVLAPGQCVTITFTYNHSFAGTDRLPVLLKIMRGREIMLNFTGVTVELDRHYVHFPSKKHIFSPVPIGGVNNPKQVYELYNGGALPVQYDIDLRPLQFMKEENFNHEVFKCLNPNGEIAAGRTASLEWIFSPLEAKSYMVDLPIHIVGGDTALVTLTGVGYDQRVMGDTMPLSDQNDLVGVPAVQTVAIPGQLVYLSQERVSFGNMPVFSQARRFVYLTNRSPTHIVSFEWYVTSEADSQVVDIQPVTGVLRPLQTALCKVSFVAPSEPSFFDLDVVCEVTDETEMAAYKKDLEEWEHEKFRQQNEFTITEKDLAKPKSQRVKSTPALCKLEKQRARAASESDLKKYQTLPPIKNFKSDRELDEQAEREKYTATGTPLWNKPTAPPTFLLHLGLTARTHTLAEFESSFPNQLNKFYIDKSMSKKPAVASGLKASKDQLAAESEDKQTELKITKEERKTAGVMLANVIRGLLDDADFHLALQEIKKESIPYFNQFTRSPPTPRVKTPPPQTPPLPPPASAKSSGRQTEELSKSSQDGLKEDGSEVKGEVATPAATTPKPQGSPMLGSRRSTPKSVPTPSVAPTERTSPVGVEEGVDERESLLEQAMAGASPSPSLPQPSTPVSVLPVVPPLQVPANPEAGGPMVEGEGLDPETERQFERSVEEEKLFLDKMSLKRLPEFGNMLESLMENTLHNLLVEASRTEISLTSRPRLVALPPKPKAAPSIHSNTQSPPPHPHPLPNTQGPPSLRVNSATTSHPAASVRTRSDSQTKSKKSDQHSVSYRHSKLSRKTVGTDK